jgi:hypothetical protein
MLLVSPELHQHVQEKTAHHDQTCKSDDRHEVLPVCALVGLSAHSVDHHSETVVKKSGTIHKEFINAAA